MMGIFLYVHLFILLNFFRVILAIKSENETDNRKHLPLQYIIDDSLGFQGLSSSDVAFHASKVPSAVIKKCCPWGAFFDIETLTCEVSSDRSRTGNFTVAEIRSMEKSFIKLYVKNYLRDYEFSVGILPCDDSKVYTSQVTTEFTIESGIPKLEGEVIKEEYCVDERRGKGTVLLRCHHENVCKSRPCIRKCKAFGDFFGKDEEGILELPRMTKEFYNLKTLEVDSLVTISAFGVYMGNTCGGRGRNKLSPETDPNDEYFLGSDGRLYIPESKQKYFTNEEFCIEYIKDENISDVHAFLCFPKPVPRIQYYLLAGCFLISCVFLLATFLVYLFSPKTQILYGKSLMCYVASLFSAYLTLAVVQINTDNMETEVCAFAGYSTLFFFLAAFFWLNIMSIDMWKTFRSTRLARFNKSSKGNVQFLWYSLYAWAIPSMLTGLTVAADFVPNFVPPTMRPGIGDPFCWFSNYTKGIHVFFIFPISLVILCNTVLFIDTARRCWKIKSEIIRMGNQSKKKYAANKTQLMINLKLFIAMGVVWSLEVISFFFDHPIWYISDAANALHGVFIFAVFVMKKKVLAGLHHRIRKPFIRMKNIKKKGLDDSGVLEDTTITTTAPGRKNYGRSSSTNITEAQVPSLHRAGFYSHGPHNLLYQQPRSNGTFSSSHSSSTITPQRDSTET